MKHSPGSANGPDQTLTEDWRNSGFALYVHWPFCLSKCPYCDFNSHVAKPVDQGRWADRYLAEIRRLGEDTEGRILGSVYFGGGTPSLMEAETVDRIMAAIRGTWTLSNDCEITLEANPGAVDASRFSAYRNAGIDRVSIGVQALDDQDLRRLGRLHGAKEAHDAVSLARSIFPRVSFDLIYARQDQSLSQWRQELLRALDMGPDHLSLYQLTIEEGTVFAQRKASGHLRGLPDESLSVDMFEMTQALCAEVGLQAYEVSNHARPGEESRHNLIYWTAGDYIGIGPGAHGRLTRSGQRWATESIRQPKPWLDAVDHEGAEQRQALSPADQAAEYVMMGLRLTTGISLARLAALDAHALSASGIAEALDLGLVVMDKERLATTPKGRLLLNQVISKVLQG